MFKLNNYFFTNIQLISYAIVISKTNIGIFKPYRIFLLKKEGFPTIMADCLLVIVLSFDIFLACIAFAVQKIKIPLFSKVIIALVGTCFLGFSLSFGGILSNFLPRIYFSYIGFAILFILAMINITESLLKKWIKKKLSRETPVQVNFLRLTLNICLDNTCADTDSSKTLSPSEALMLALPLSVDSLFTGLSMDISSPVHIVVIIICSFVFGLSSAVLGTKFSSKLENMKKTSNKDLSWISGILLLFLAIEQLL